MASTMNFETCHIVDFLSMSSQGATLPGMDMDFPFDDLNVNCNESIDYEMPSLFPLANTPNTTNMDVHTDPLDVAFMAFLGAQCLLTLAIYVILTMEILRHLLFPYIRTYVEVMNNHFTTGLTLTFVGIKPPTDCGISTHSMFDRVDTTKTIQTVYTKLQPDDTIQSLKTAIKRTYSVPDTMDVLVVFAHHLISKDTLTLHECGITDRSLLTLALCESGRVNPDKSHFTGYTPLTPGSTAPVIEYGVDFDPQTFFGMYSDDDSSDDEAENVQELSRESSLKNAPDVVELDVMAPRMGFDVVMQEDGVTVYKMAGCGHEMNPESLYHYALSQYSEKTNLSVKCPHFECEKPCKHSWDYHDVASVLRRSGTDFDVHKLQLLAARNRVQNSCNVQKCPSCHTLYFQNEDDAVNLGDIDTKEDVERFFKRECVFCSFVCTKQEPYYQPRVIPPAPITVDAVDSVNTVDVGAAAAFPSEETYNFEVDGNAINNLFGHFADSDADTGSDEEPEIDSDQEEEALIMERINALFEDDEPEIVHNPLYVVMCDIAATMHRTLHSMKCIAVRGYEAADVCTRSMYNYMMNLSGTQMVEDMVTALYGADAVLYGKCAVMVHVVYSTLMGTVNSVINAVNTKYNEFIESFLPEEVEEEVVVPVVVEEVKHRKRRRRVDADALDLYDGGLFNSFSDDSDSEDEDIEEQEAGDLEYTEYSDYEADVIMEDERFVDYQDSDDEEEERLSGLINAMFDDDGISDAEQEEKTVFGYDAVTTVQKAFCWGCGVDWEEGHVCDSSFKQDLCDILSMAEKKKIGEQENVPSIRSCPNCCQLITHTQACKHMDCRNCRKSFCFVCLKPRLNTGWQCGSYSSRCPDGVAAVQGMESLPDAIVITKNAFHLY